MRCDASNEQVPLQKEYDDALGNARTIGIALQLADSYDLPTEAVQA
jgi:hypothetical protein